MHIILDKKENTDLLRLLEIVATIDKQGGKIIKIELKKDESILVETAAYLPEEKVKEARKVL